MFAVDSTLLSRIRYKPEGVLNPRHQPVCNSNQGCVATAKAFGFPFADNEPAGGQLRARQWGWCVRARAAQCTWGWVVFQPLQFGTQCTGTRWHDDTTPLIVKSSIINNNNNDVHARPRALCARTHQPYCATVTTPTPTTSTAPLTTPHQQLLLRHCAPLTNP